MEDDELLYGLDLEDLPAEMSFDELIEFFGFLRSNFTPSDGNVESFEARLRKAEESLLSGVPLKTVAEDVSQIAHDLDTGNSNFVWAKFDEDSGVFTNFGDCFINNYTGLIGDSRHFVRLESPIVRVAGRDHSLGFFLFEAVKEVFPERLRIDSPEKILTISHFKEMDILKRSLYPHIRDDLFPRVMHYKLSMLSISPRYFIQGENYGKYHFNFDDYAKCSHEYLNAVLKSLEYIRENELYDEVELEELTTRAERLKKLTSHMSHFSGLLFDHYEAVINGMAHWNTSVLVGLFKALDEFLLDPSEANAQAYLDRAREHQNLDPKRVWINGKSKTALRIGPVHQGDLKRAMNDERAHLEPLIEDIELQALFKGWELS